MINLTQSISEQRKLMNMWLMERHMGLNQHIEEKPRLRKDTVQGALTLATIWVQLFILNIFYALNYISNFFGYVFCVFFQIFQNHI